MQRPWGGSVQLHLRDGRQLAGRAERTSGDAGEGQRSVDAGQTLACVTVNIGKGGPWRIPRPSS